MIRFLKVFCFVLIITVFLSCSENTEKEISETKITKDIQLEFLSAISKDTTQIFSDFYSNAYVFEKKFTNTQLPITKDKKTRWFSQVELISKYLNTKDTIFVHDQIQLNPLNMDDLVKAGFKTVDYDRLISRSFIEDSLIEKKLVSQDSLDAIFNLIEKHNYIQILKPIFNKTLDLAYIQVDYKEFSGKSMIYKKTNKGWIFNLEISSWMR
ncbi:hypothetical protein [Psychroserpens luteus]|uniref:Lipoprotein n=1 Tax=Psychroserpens luteus TaxID=1434066 RepID=A0ABW5ZYP8_9FLAO|nr:hypothetical protein [Psychroserpens luteus]